MRVRRRTADPAFGRYQGLVSPSLVLRRRQSPARTVVKGAPVANETEAVCDYYLGEFGSLEKQFLREEARAQAVSVDLAKRLVYLCEQLARRLLERASATRARDVAAAVQAHRLHREIILQS